MLVLSRRPFETILFPSIHTSVQVLAVKGRLVRLGIEAPPELAILRAELADSAPGPVPAGGLLPSGRLGQLCADLAALRARLPPDAAAELARVEAELKGLCLREAPRADATPRPHRPAGGARRALLVED
jgi:carbon storage regulator CsrA